ncbi:Protein MLO [Camellia lanceoleosa]|uniref:Protein MLO n=1 Tax=Camellia lanceoleosa TaxID=1840588 RepID=A0ACC0HUM5_9ERIC|nr:Protein MLO [Camellia lanceoleosa]
MEFNTTMRRHQHGKFALVSELFVIISVLIEHGIHSLEKHRPKLKKWKAWEQETNSLEYQFNNDPARFRFAHQTSFVRQHSGFSTMPRSQMGCGFL